MYGRFGLRPTHIDKGLTKLDYGFDAYEEASNFGFGSRGHEKNYYLGDSEDRAISGRDRSFFGGRGVVTNLAAGFSDIKVVSILVVSEHHATSLVEDEIVRMSGYIIKELEKGSVGVFGGRILFLAELVDINKEFFIKISSVI